MGVGYDPGFLTLLASIEKDKIPPDDNIQADYNTLLNARNLVELAKHGFNPDNAASIPVKIIHFQTADLLGRISTDIYRDLSRQFHVVNSYTDAALVVEVHNVRNNAAAYLENGYFASTTSFCIKATWVGGQILFDKLITNEKETRGADSDAMRVNGKGAETDSYNSAVHDEAVPLFSMDESARKRFSPCPSSQ